MKPGVTTATDPRVRWHARQCVSNAQPSSVWRKSPGNPPTRATSRDNPTKTKLVLRRRQRTGVTFTQDRASAGNGQARGRQSGPSWSRGHTRVDQVLGGCSFSPPPSTASATAATMHRRPWGSLPGSWRPPGDCSGSRSRCGSSSSAMPRISSLPLPTSGSRRNTAPRPLAIVRGQVHPAERSEAQVERESDPDPEGIGERVTPTPPSTSGARRWWRRRESNPRPKARLRETLQV